MYKIEIDINSFQRRTYTDKLKKRAAITSKAGPVLLCVAYYDSDVVNTSV